MNTVLAVGGTVALCAVLALTSSARRNLLAWKWGGSGPRWVMMRSSVRRTRPTTLRAWTALGVLVVTAAVAIWVLGAWFVAILVGLIGLSLLGMAFGGWRTNRSLAPPTSDPVADVVDRGLLRFSPRVDDLIREICELGGRDRLAGFDWGDPNAPRRDLDGLYQRLKTTRDTLTIFR
jgi:hypothetical protein